MIVVGSWERADRAVTVAKLAGLAEFYGVATEELLPAHSAGPAAAGGRRLTIDLQRLVTLPTRQAGPLARYAAAKPAIRTLGSLPGAAALHGGRNLPAQPWPGAAHGQTAELSDLRESGSLEQDADMVILVHRPDAWEADDPRAGEADVIIAKRRNGPTTTVAVAHQQHYSRFADGRQAVDRAPRPASGQSFRLPACNRAGATGNVRNYPPAVVGPDHQAVCRDCGVKDCAGERERVMPGNKPPEFDLRARCESYAQMYHRRPEQLEKGLVAYAVHLFAREPGFDAALDGEATTEANLAAHLCESNELHVDAVLEDEVGRRLLLIHAAWRHKDLDERRIAAFFHAPDRILTHGYAVTGGDQIHDLLAGFAEKVEDGYEILLRFVTNLPAARRAQLAITTAAQNHSYENTGRPIRCEVYGIADLSKREDELGSAVGGGLVEPVTLNLQSGHFTALDAPFRTLVGVVKANELVDLYNRAGVGNTLFHPNIRPLGSRRANPKIVMTALSDDEAAYFFYYNNGVSAVCTEYTLSGNTVTAKRFQVVDGARTVSALAQALHRKPTATVYLLLRLTAAADSYGGPFTDNVTRYTNTQNSVKVPALFANDPIQQWLRENFTLISGRGPVPVIHYRHRSGQRPEHGPGKGITIEQLAGIRHAYLYGPVPSYREPAQFFDRELRYAEAFGINGREVDRWPEEALFETAAVITINQRVHEISRTLATGPATKDTDEARYLHRLARYVTALVGVGLEAVRPWTFHDYATLTASPATFDQHVNPMLEKARAVLRHEFTTRTIGPPHSRPEYRLARDEPTWTRLRDTLRQQVLTDSRAPGR